MALWVRRFKLDDWVQRTEPVDAWPQAQTLGTVTFERREGLLVARPGPDPTQPPTLNGAILPEPRALSHGDVVHAGAELFVVLARAPACNPALEEALREDPTDEDRVRVYADWLQEQGEGLGTWLLQRPEPPRSPQPALLEGVWIEHDHGVLQFEWAAGLARSVCLRAGDSTQRWEVVLAQALALPLAAFARELSLDLLGLLRRRRSYETWERVRSDPNTVGLAELEEAVRTVARILALSPQRRTLNTLRLGYAADLDEGAPEGLEANAPLMAALREACPRLTSPVVLRRPQAAAFVIEKIPPDMPLLAHREGSRYAIEHVTSVDPVGPMGAFPLHAVGPWGQLGRSNYIGLEQGRWVLHHWNRTAFARLNGRKVTEAPLLPGDLLTIDPGLSLRFVLDDDP